MRRSVLGIDAAWTAVQASGVALAAEGAEGWRLVAARSSYADFAAAGRRALPAARAAGGLPDAASLLDACEALYGTRPNVVAVDMPLSLSPITGRRVSDNLISRQYGARHCGTHSPSAQRPGRIADALRAAFAREGYALATAPPVQRGLIEVYPHPALVELANAARRLPYKAGKVRGYWPERTPAERRAMLFAEWARIVRLLDAEIGGVAAALPLPPGEAKGAALKSFEDSLDAVVCAWIGIRVLMGRACAFGDAESAIWVPGQAANP